MLLAALAICLSICSINGRVKCCVMGKAQALQVAVMLRLSPAAAAAAQQLGAARRSPPLGLPCCCQHLIPDPCLASAGSLDNVSTECGLSPSLGK